MIVTLVLQFEEARVVAIIGDELLLIDFVNLVDYPVHEGTVVRNDQECAGILLKVALEPHQRVQVEVVRRLVQHEKIGLLHQKTG